MKRKPETALIPPINPSDMAVWASILGGGIGITTPLGISLKDFLCRHLTIPEDYLACRIQTILHNCRPVDHVEKTIIAGNDVIALSAAMPGLAGAALRRGGHLAPMRAAIPPPRGQTMPSEKPAGMVILKLFNLVAKEMGPQILAGEILLRARDLTELQKTKIIPQHLKIPSDPNAWAPIRPADFRMDTV